MFKKVFAALVVSSVAFVATPAFSATEADVVTSCTTGACIVNVKAFLAAVPVAQRAAAARSLAAALAQAGLTAGAAKANFAAALGQVAADVAAIDPALSQQVAQLGDTLGGDNTDTATATVGAASAN